MFLLLYVLLRFSLSADGLRFDNVSYSFRVPEKWGVLSWEDAHCCPRGIYASNKTLEGYPVPTLIGIGVQKGGSSSLSAYMSRHTDYARSRTKETHFFDKETPKSIAQYQKIWKNKRNSTSIRYEFTPSYLWVPLSACRVKKLFPQMKFVVILRDPASRAFSEFNMVRTRCRRPGKACSWVHRDFFVYVKKGVNNLKLRHCTFRDGDGAKNWNDCFQCLIFSNRARAVCQNRPYFFRLHSRNTCFHFGAQVVSRGLYAAQLAWWFELFPPSNFVIVNSQDMFQNPLAQMKRINSFLGVKKPFQGWMTKSQGMKGKYNKFTDNHLEEAKKFLTAYFLRPNQELYRLLDEVNRGPFTPFEQFWQTHENDVIDQITEDRLETFQESTLQEGEFTAPQESTDLLSVQKTPSFSETVTSVAPMTSEDPPTSIAENDHSVETEQQRLETEALETYNDIMHISSPKKERGEEGPASEDTDKIYESVTIPLGEPVLRHNNRIENHFQEPIKQNFSYSITAGIILSGAVICSMLVFGVRRKRRHLRR